MEQHTFSIFGENSLTLPVPSWHTFIFSFSAWEFRRIEEIAIDLIFKKLTRHRVVLTPSDGLVEDQVTIQVRSGESIAFVTLSELTHDDRNIIVKVIRDPTKSFTTYINDELIATTEPVKKNSKTVINKAGVQIKTNDPRQVVVALSVFSKKKINSGIAEEVEKEIRNHRGPGFPQIETTVDAESKTMEDHLVDDGDHLEGAKKIEAEAHARVQAEADPQKLIVDHDPEFEKIEEAKALPLAGLQKDIALNQKAVEELEKTMAQLRSLVADNQEELEASEKEIDDLTRVITDFEKTADKRQKAADHSNFRGGGNGDADVKLTSGLNVNPPDADLTKVSATVAWPRAIRHVLGASVADQLQQTHDSVMVDWVEARGDDLSSKAYDFFVYSHGVAWPKVVVESITDADVTKIWERHGFIMEILA